MLSKEQGSKSTDDHIKQGEWKKKKIRYYAGRVIVKLKPPASDSDKSAASLCDELAASLPSGRVRRYAKATGRTVLYFDAKSSVTTIARQLSERADVEYAEPDVVDSAMLIPSDTRYADQWGPDLIGAPGAWALETGNNNALIGIIDSGISTTAGGALDHPDLNAAGRYMLGTDFVDGGAPRDLRGHGTHVTGIAAAESNNAQGVAGMNWSSQVYICRTLDASGNGSSADFADAVEEITDFAVANNLKAVINYSAGGGANQTKQDACQYAHDRGVMLCAATGNDNGGPVIFPAAYSTTFDNVVAVGSIDSNDTVSSFSNVGPEVTVVAPGRGILSTMPTYAVTIPAALNYDFLDGTSMATPFVTGLISLMWSRHPGFTHTAIRNCLTGTAVKLGAGNFNNSWGFGRIDAEAALRCGDFVFPSLFTYFTRFTIFTLFTRFTAFTPLTPFTRFSPFTRFEPFSRFIGRFRKPVQPVRFVRVGKMVFDPAELDIKNFKELRAAAGDLRRVGIKGVHELAAADHTRLAKAMDYSVDEAALLVKLSKQILSELSSQ